MENLDKINLLSAEDRFLLTDLASTFDLGTQTIIGRDKDEIIDDLSDSISEMNEDWLNHLKARYKKVTKSTPLNS